MRPLVLTSVVGLAAGVMNMIPWGGPTVRAMAALDLDSSDIFTPVLPAMGAGIVWVLLASFLHRTPGARRTSAPSPPQLVIGRPAPSSGGGTADPAGSAAAADEERAHCRPRGRAAARPVDPAPSTSC